MPWKERSVREQRGELVALVASGVSIAESVTTVGRDSPDAGRSGGVVADGRERRGWWIGPGLVGCYILHDPARHEVASRRCGVRGFWGD